MLIRVGPRGDCDAPRSSDPTVDARVVRTQGAFAVSVSACRRPRTPQQIRPPWPPAPRRRKLYIGATAVNAGLLSLIVVAYYTLPTAWDGATAALRVAIAVAILTVVLAVSVRIVKQSEYPMLRALQTLTVGVAFAIVSFASAYLILSSDDAAAFTESLGRTDALYFSMTTATTVGFGDVSPKSEAARIVVMLHMVVNVVVIGGAARLLFNVARRRAEPR